jgi:hypothetical protein
MAKYIAPVTSGATSKDAGMQDQMDCTVRALANATGMPYADAHKLLEEAGRVNGKGCRINQYHDVYKAAGFEASFRGPRGRSWAKYYRLDGQMERGRTLARVVAENPTGRHIVIVTGHAVALVDGVLIDTFNNKAGKIVSAVYSLK